MAEVPTDKATGQMLGSLMPKMIEGMIGFVDLRFTLPADYAIEVINFVKSLSAKDSERLA